MKVLPSKGFDSRARAYLSGAQSIVKATWTKILFDTESYDELGEYDNVTNYRFTASAAGYYRFSAAVGLVSVDISKSYLITVRLNGTDILFINERCGSAGAVGDCPVGEIYLNVGDYLEVWVYQNSAANKNTNHNYGDPYFCVSRFA